MEAWLIDKDFVNYWVAARLVLDGQVRDLFADHATYFRHLTDLFGPDLQWRNWSYPPHYLLLIWPLGLVGYVPALVAFLGVTLVGYLAALRAFVGRTALALPVLAVAVGPSVISNLQNAQNGFLTAALMLGGLALRDRRPVLAGVLFGLLTVKPQLGLLVPILLLVERRWLVILSAGVTTVALVGLSAALFGWDSWQGYLTETLAYQSQVMTQFTGLFLGLMPTTFGALRSLGVTPDVALAAHGVVAGVAFVLAARAFLRCGDPTLRAALMIMTTLVVTPYWLTYDYGIAAAALLVGPLREAGPRQNALGLLAAMVPVLALPLWTAGLPLTPVLVLVGFALVLQSAARRDDRQAHGTD